MAAFPLKTASRRPPAFPGALLLLSLLLVGEGVSSESARGFRMYRNPPKPRLALLPSTGTLDSAARAALDAALADAAGDLEDVRLILLPAAAVPATGRRPTAAVLAGLSRRHAVDLVLHSRAERRSDSLFLSATVLDARTGAVRTSFRAACRCGADSLASAAREGVRSLRREPRLRAFRCGERMALIPADSAGGGAAAGSAGSSRAGGFCIDLYEFPNQPAGEPVVGRTWKEAAEACAEQGKRLCTEAEWSLACGGREGLAYPYGDAYAEDRCNTRSRTIRLSGSDAGCRSPFDVRDLSGNVYEWTSSPWSGRFKDKVVKGGNWGAGAENSSCKARFGQAPDAPSPAIGFRCCLTLETLGGDAPAEEDPPADATRRGPRSR